MKFIVPGLYENTSGVLVFSNAESISKCENNVYLYSPERIVDNLKYVNLWGRL